MNKRIMSLFVCSVMLTYGVPAAFAQGNSAILQQEQTAQTQETKVYTLSLEDAIKMAREKDPAFISADVKIADAERQLKQARTNKKDLEGIPIKISQGLTSFALQRGYFIKQAEIGVESAKMEKDKAIANSAYSVTQQYYGVKLSERVLQSAKNGLEMAESNLETIKMQFSLGLVAELDVNNAKLAVKKAQAAFNKYERSLDLARKALAVKLFIDEEDFLLNLTDDIEYTEFETQLDNDIQKAMENRYDVFMLESALSQAEFMADIADLYGISSAEYSSANQAKVQSEVTCQNSKKMIGVSITSSYNSILDAKDALDVAEAALALKRQEYNIASIEHQLGLMTNIQLTGVMNGVTAAEIELENAKLTYKLAVEKYGYEIEIGL